MICWKKKIKGAKEKRREGDDFMEEMNILGIDLGTTNSAMAFIEMEEPAIIENKEGERITPSIVFFKENGEVVVGKVAKQNIIANPDRTIRSIKRKMGTDYKLNLDGEAYPPEYISAHILKKLVNNAHNSLNRKFRNVVVSVPAYFTDSQRQATKDAAEIAGLRVKRIINEPTAAALAYGFSEDEEKRILVCDFGGGTFDVSILSIDNGFFDVDASGGDNHLGGDDLDEILMNYVIKKIEKKCKIDVRKDLGVMQSIREAVEDAKIRLSTEESTVINLPYVGRYHGKPRSYSIELSREKFNELTREIIERTRKPLKQVMEDATISPSDVDDILLVGGSTRIPAVRELVRDFFGKEPNVGINPEEVVALGAAISGIEGVKEEISGKIRKSIEISDVVSHSLGVLTFDGTISQIIERNTKVPIAKTQEFTNPLPYMDEIKIPVYQGEFIFPEEEGHLGEFWISIEPKPSLRNKIDVSFDVGKEFGILYVTARDHDSGNERTVRMEAFGRLTKHEKSKWMKKLLKVAGIRVKVENAITKDAITMYLNPNATVYDVKQELIDKDILQQGMLLFHDGKGLDEKLLISETSIIDDDRLEVDYPPTSEVNRKNQDEE